MYGAFIYNTAKQAVLNQTDTQLKMMSADLIPDFKPNAHEDAKQISNDLSQEFNISPIFIKQIYYNKKDKIIEYSNISSKQEDWIFDIPLNETGKYRNVYYFDKEIYRVSSTLIYENDETKVFIQLAIKRDIDSPYLKHVYWGILISTPFALIIFTFIVNLLIKSTLRPVDKVIDSVKEISANNLSNSISTKNIPIEIKELVTTFNHLLKELEDSFNKITDFSNNASHELKTPLTVIRGEIEVALKHDREAEEYKNILHNILQESISIQDMIEQLLFLAKKDTNELNNDFYEVYMDEIILDSVSKMKKLALKKNIDLNIRKIIPLNIYANEILLKVAITNILRNAITYSPNNSTVHISLDENTTEYILEIKDEGFGIEKKDLKHVFDKFYRADKSRSRKIGRVGLGLSIVKMILELHNYPIEITSSKDSGTTVNIKISKIG